MTFFLHNDYWSIEISSKGAELRSLYSCIWDREYLWQGASEAWSGRSLLLFPAAGRIDRSRILVDGKEYPMPMHGFAKDMEFTAAEYQNHFLALELSDNAQTLKMFPYHFKLRVEFSLQGDRVFQNFRIFNTGDRPLFFSLGAHPGFFCPIVLGESAEDYVLEFDHPQMIREIVLEPGTRLCTDERNNLFDNISSIPLSETFFNAGPILAEGCNADWIQLRSRHSGHFIRMGMEKFPYLTLWGVPNRMSLICIEPWCGTSDFTGTDHQWESKPGICNITPGEAFFRQLWFDAGQYSR